MGEGLFEIRSTIGLLLLAFAVLLLGILVVSFRSRPIVFCQYLHAMTGISLSPAQVREAFEARGREGVRELFLELIIQEDLQQGPLKIPEPKTGAGVPGAETVPPPMT